MRIRAAAGLSRMQPAMSIPLLLGGNKRKLDIRYPEPGLSRMWRTDGWADEEIPVPGTMRNRLARLVGKLIRPIWQVGRLRTHVPGGNANSNFCASLLRRLGSSIVCSPGFIILALRNEICSLPVSTLTVPSSQHSHEIAKLIGSPPG